MKYRKKPIVVEAVQFTEEMVKAYLWDGGKLPDGVDMRTASHHPGRRVIYNYRAAIQTLEGLMDVKPGDWIITGVKGEHYPCKPDIFAATYEPADESEVPHA